MNIEKYVILLLSILFFSPSFADDRICWVEYKYDGQTDGPGGAGGSSMTGGNHEAFVYKLCKKQCYDRLPNYKNIAGVKSCSIDGVPIEESKYKKFYLENKEKICHVKAEGKPFNLYIAETESECKAHMKNFIWCKKGANCTFSLGRW